jgi:hypothetical protein
MPNPAAIVKVNPAAAWPPSGDRPSRRPDQGGIVSFAEGQPDVVPEPGDVRLIGAAGTADGGIRSWTPPCRRIRADDLRSQWRRRSGQLHSENTARAMHAQMAAPQPRNFLEFASTKSEKVIHNHESALHRSAPSPSVKHIFRLGQQKINLE